MTRPAPGVLDVRPEVVAVVEVVDCEVAARSRVQRGEGRRAARLVGQARAAGPEDRRRRDRTEVELVARDVHVGRLRLAVEEHREIVRRKDLAEDDRRAQLRVGAHPTGVDAKTRERRPNVVAEAVPTDLRDHRGAPAETGGRHGDVRRTPAEGLRERAHVREVDADLLRVKIDADPAHRDDLEIRHGASRCQRCARSMTASPPPGSGPSMTRRRARHQSAHTRGRPASPRPSSAPGSAAV